MFCGSSSHTRGVECDQPTVFNRYVISGTVHAFQKLTPSERRRALKGQRWRNTAARSMPRSGGDGAGKPDISSDSSNSTGAELSAGTHDARTRSARARAKTGSHARPATGVAVDSATRAELAEARREAHAHKQANRELQRRVAELERQHAAPLAANAARTGMGLPSSVNTLNAVKHAEATTHEHERELVKLRRQIDDLNRLARRNTALLATDAERRSSGACMADSHPRRAADIAQCYASGTLFCGPALVHTLNELHEHADSCGRCQATIFLAEHRAHHDRIQLRRHELLPSAAPSDQQAAARSQHGRRQHDTHAPHQRAAAAQPTPATHTGAGQRTRDDATPIVSTSAAGYTTPKLDSRSGLDCCVVGCDVNVDALWFYHRDHNKDRRRVCSTCMRKWRDLRLNFGTPYRAYSDGHWSADAAAHMAQAVCRGFLARMRMARRRARAQALGQPGQATPQQVHANAVAARKAAEAAMQRLCCPAARTATLDQLRVPCKQCSTYTGPMLAARRLALEHQSAAATAQQRSQNLRRAEARVEMKATANRHAATHWPRTAVRVWHARVRHRALQCSVLARARWRQQRRSWATWRVYITPARRRLAGAVCIQRAWRHCAARTHYECAVMRLRSARRRHTSRRLQRAWEAWHAYTTAKLAKAADAVPARRQAGTHVPRTARLALATLPILLRAARRWQDAHAGRSGLPAPRRPLGTLGIWQHGTCQQRNAQGERTGPTALRRLEGSPTASPHAAAPATSAARIQRVWRRRVAHTRCMHTTLQLQAALRRRTVVAAVTCIQRVWRRCMVHAHRKHATTIVQAALRRHNVLRRLLKLRHARALDAAAARIQRFRRRYTARARRTTAATAIQALWRGCAMRSELLYPPGTRPFDETHNAAAGMRVCLSPDGKDVPAGYNWCEETLAPDINGTIVRIEHRVDGVAVYVRSDDASRHIQPYAVEHLLRLVPTAYDDWGALLGFTQRHAAYCSVHEHACSRTLRQAWLAWHAFSHTAQQLHTLYVHAARHSHRKQLRGALHSWQQHHRRAMAARLHARHQLQQAWLAWCTHAQSTRRLHASYVHIAGQVFTRLLRTGMHSWHLHHRRQRQHNLASRHACVHLARTALRAWWRVWQQPTHGDGFDFELLTKPTAPPTPTAPSGQPTPGHGKWGAAAQDIALTTPTCHTPAHHRSHTPCTPVAHMSQHEDALSACKTAPRGAAPPTSPSTPTPPTPHDDAIVARANADKAAADQSILQRLARLYEDSLWS